MTDAAAATEVATQAEEPTVMSWEQQQAAGPEDERLPEKVERPYEVLARGEFTKGIEHVPGMTVMLRDDVAVQFIQAREIQEETRPEEMWVKFSTKLTGRKLAARLDKLSTAAGIFAPPKVAEDPDEDD